MPLDPGYLSYRLDETFSGIYYFFTGEESSFFDFVFLFKIIAGTVSVLLAAGTVYNILKLSEIRRRHLKELAKRVIESAEAERVSRWDRIKEYLKSENSSDWRRAILDADNLLYDIFTKIGYKGPNLGIILIKIKPYIFQSRNDVLRAHLERNKIIYEGGKFELTREETERILNLYETALKELEYI